MPWDADREVGKERFSPCFLVSTLRHREDKNFSVVTQEEDGRSYLSQAL